LAKKKYILKPKLTIFSRLCYELFSIETEDIFSKALTAQYAQSEQGTGFIVLVIHNFDSSLHFHHLFPNEPMHHVWHIVEMLPLPWPCFSTLTVPEKTRKKS
jgi:hypothetical protein